MIEYLRERIGKGFKLERITAEYKLLVTGVLNKLWQTPDGYPYVLLTNGNKERIVRILTTDLITISDDFNELRIEHDWKSA